MHICLTNESGYDINIFLIIHVSRDIFLFRQAEPSPDNKVTAASTLPEAVQQHIAKKVVVNAKVTFGIWILETVAFALCSKTFLVILKRATRNHLSKIHRPQKWLISWWCCLWRYFDVYLLPSFLWPQWFHFFHGALYSFSFYWFIESMNSMNLINSINSLNSFWCF